MRPAVAGGASALAPPDLLDGRTAVAGRPRWSRWPDPPTVLRMPINPDAVGYTSEPREASWDSKDCLLYALGVGAGVIDPTGFELEFTTENSQDVTQRVLPTFPVVVGGVGGGGGAFAQLGSFNPAMLVHGEQSVEAARPAAGRRHRRVGHHHHGHL